MYKVSWCHQTRYNVDISHGIIIQKCAGVAGLGAMNGLCYPDTDEGFLHTLASTAARTSPAQPIWESNIDTHFLTSGWRARGSGRTF